ncbi:MAG: hypothetical protein Q8Q59_10335 [Luteolibacter sp.]|nr:hypothetical protein [Luteolibacter sp.]
MKTSQWAAVSAAVTAMCALATSPCLAQGNSGHATFPAMPSGWLTAFPTVVQTGTHPTLTWGINYPSVVEDYVTITPPSTITADEELDCEIRVLGAGVTVSSSGSQSFSFVPTEAQVSYNGGDYTRIFYGTNLQVNPNTVVWSRTIAKNKKLRFGGRYYYNKNWGPYFNSSSGTDNVRTLVNGSTPPSNVPEYNAPSLESFIKPYLTATNKVQIGPMDVIVFMELTHTNSQKSDPGYDLQDMVLLVTFKSKAKTNNGHGNNIDGIDSSNPGNAPFINLDTDPAVDDEGGGGGAAPSDP